MFEKILNEKSMVDAENERWIIDCQWSEYNQCGSLGRNDCIKRQDAVRLLGEMNIKLVRIIEEYEKGNKNNPQLTNLLRQSTSVLSYAMWGLKELEPVQTSDIESNTELSIT